MLIASPLLMRNVGHVEEINCKAKEKDEAQSVGLEPPHLNEKRRYESVLENRKRGISFLFLYTCPYKSLCDSTPPHSK